MIIIYLKTNTKKIINSLVVPPISLKVIVQWKHNSALILVVGFTSYHVVSVVFFGLKFYDTNNNTIPIIIKNANFLS